MPHRFNGPRPPIGMPTFGALPPPQGHSTWSQPPVIRPGIEPCPPGEGAQTYNPIDSYMDFFSKKDTEKASPGVVEKRCKSLSTMKDEDFYLQYKELLSSNPDVERVEDPDHHSNVSDGVWEDLLRKWKIQITVLLKLNKEKVKAVDDIDSGTDANLLPNFLNDNRAVGDIVE